MKVKIPKSFLDLPQSEKDKINEVITQEIPMDQIAEYFKGDYRR